MGLKTAREYGGDDGTRNGCLIDSAPLWLIFTWPASPVPFSRLTVFHASLYIRVSRIDEPG
jgi:hypothetical protein